MRDSMIPSHGQIYQYNGTELTKEKFNTETFINEFSFQNLPQDQTTWVNFYVLDDLASVETFCKKENYDALVFHNIREKDNRPQFEDYEHYLFFSVFRMLKLKQYIQYSAFNNYKKVILTKILQIVAKILRVMLLRLSKIDKKINPHSFGLVRV